MNNVIGIGIDIVEIARLEGSLEKFGDQFKERIFTDREREYCESMKYPARNYAARFAAKEAICKAFGTGITDRVGWKEMEILRRENGEPYVELHGDTKAFAEERGIASVLVSLSHEQNYAAAQAVAVG